MGRTLAKLNFRLDDQVEDTKDTKKPKLKGVWDKVFNVKKLKKPDTVAVVLLRDNGNAEPLEAKAIRGMFNINGKVYHEREDCKYTLNYKGERTPFIVVHENMLHPEPNKEYYERGFQKRMADLQDMVTRAIKNAEIVKVEGDSNSKINPKLLIAGAIGLIIMFALFQGGIV